SIVSTENTDLGYTPPPGVVDEAGRRDAGFQLGAVQINERSMRVLARGLGTGERAETYLRFTTEGDKNFLKYQFLRVWARGAGPDSTLVQFDTAYVMCDGPYIVHVKDPGTAPPNLVAVQEIAAGIWRVKTNVFIDQAELWVDDIRLADVVQETGVAGAVDIS